MISELAGCAISITNLNANAKRCHLFAESLQTCGVECTTAQLPIPDTTVAVDLIISELAGCDVYHSSAGQYLDGTHAALIVFDVSSQTSYEHCKKWLEVLRQARWVAYFCSGPLDKLMFLLSFCVH